MFVNTFNDDAAAGTPVLALASPYLTATEAAAYLRSTVQGIYSLVKRGRVKPMPGSGKLLFTREALDRYLSTRRR
jgi:excisionase family DNA binding protein